MVKRRYRVAIVGAGPRGISVLERLLANRSAGAPELSVHLIDPHAPGPGHVWDTGQSRLFLMNTPALFPTVVPVDGTYQEGLAPPVAGLSFDAWRQLMRSDGISGQAAALSAEDVKELGDLGAADYPSRALYGRYLSWVHGRLCEAAGPQVTLVHHRAEALAVRPRAGEPGHRIELDDGTEVEADAVVLALGHLPTRLNADQQGLADAAGSHGLQYWAPNVPADVDWSRLPARRPVLIRGLGLNFFDIMIQLTAGRGGRFRATGAGPGRALAYEPSGEESEIIAASRRGTPYRAKAVLDTYIPRSVTLRFCTPEVLARFRESGVQPGFDRDLWPLLHRDVFWAYYTTLARVSPDAFTTDPQQFLSELDAILTAPGQGTDEPSDARYHKVLRLLDGAVPARHRFEVRTLGHPFASRTFRSGTDYDAAVLAYLEEDAAGSAAGEDDPLKMAIGALNAGRSVLKGFVSDGGITEASWLAELRGWFEQLVEGLAGGPPAQRIEQLAALVRAGVVRFVGPDPKFGVDPVHSRFTASSPWVAGTEFTASYLVEAMMPANRVNDSLSPLMRQLLRDGLVRAKLMMAANGVPVVTSGLDLTLPPYRPLDVNGQVVPGLYVIGLQLSSVQWGTAIAAEAGAPLDGGSRTLRDADDIARALLAAAPV